MTAVLESKLAETRYGVKMDDTYVRNVMLGYDSDESVAGNAKLYINKEDLDTLGKVRGTSEKKPVFDISFITPNNGQKMCIRDRRNGGQCRGGCRGLVGSDYSFEWRGLKEVKKQC